MTTFANILPNQTTDGIPYALGKSLSSLEGDLYNINPAVPASAPPVPTLYAQALLAIVKLTLQNAVPQTYVVLQTDNGDNNWIDLAWLVTSQVTGTFTYALSSAGSGGYAVQQTRAAGTPPASTDGNFLSLGARFRFVGATGVVTVPQSSLASRSSAASAGPALAQVDIRYHLTPLR